jgi:hypothetical protein
LCIDPLLFVAWFTGVIDCPINAAGLFVKEMAGQVLVSALGGFLIARVVKANGGLRKGPENS